MAYTDNFPQRPVFMADFANGGKIDPRATFSRPDSPINGSNAPASAVHYWSNEKHLSSENLLTDSNGFPAYATNNVVTPSASGSFIDGTDAFVVTETTANGYHFINSTSGQISSGTSYTSTVFVKAGTASSMQLAYAAPVFGTGVYANYDLSTPTNAPVTGADATATSTGLSDGWVRITLTGTATGSGSYPLLYLVFNNDDINSARLPTYTPASAKDFSVWEANVSTIGEKVLNQTSGSIHRQYASTLKSVSTAGQPRFEYGIDGQSEGILVESQVANLCPYSKNGFNASNTFSLASSEVVTTENAAVAPSGVLEATLVAENSATGQHNLNTGGLTASAAAHTFSAYVKDAGVGSIGMRLLGPSSSFGISLNLSTGAGSSLYDAPTSYGVEDVGNGWKRIYITATLTAASWSFMLYCQSNGSSSVSYAGDGYSGFLFYGAQVEANAFPSSWVDTGTGGSTATRAADSLSVDLTQVGFNGGPFTIVSETEGGQGSYPRAWVISDAANTNRVSVYRNSGAATTSTSWIAYATDGGTAQVSSSMSDTAGKLAVSYDTNNVSVCASGGAVTTDTTAVIPGGLNTLKIGVQVNGANNQLNGHCKRIAVFGEALSDTNLISLTS